MSLLLGSRLLNRTDKRVVDNSTFSDVLQEEGEEFKAIKRNRLWLITYISLFTSLLAFFILIITQIELEGSMAKRNYQKIVNSLYQEIQFQSKQQGLSWLQVENTLTKGVRLTIDHNTVPNLALFNSARAKINPRYLPYIRSISELIDALNVQDFRARHKKLIRGTESEGHELRLFIRIEGHTDSLPLAATARFQNNVELSTFRAYAMLDLLRLYTGLPKSTFSMAGYGSFHPLVEDTTSAVNRRVEIYLIPRLVAVKPPDQSLSDD